MGLHGNARAGGDKVKIAKTIARSTVLFMVGIGAQVFLPHPDDVLSAIGFLVVLLCFGFLTVFSFEDVKP